MKALIKNNIPYCPICGKPLKGGFEDYGLVDINGEHYYQFKKICPTKGCGTERIIYYEDVDFNKRFVIDGKNVTKIKDKVNEECETVNKNIDKHIQM